METTYAVLSDIHERVDLLPYAVHAAKQLGADKIIINGDIGSEHDIKKYYQQVVPSLEEIGKSQIECYVQPGSHEKYLSFASALSYAKDRYSNIIDILDSSFFKQKEHSIAFIPGSDFTAGGEFHIGTELESGVYSSTRHALVKFNPENYNDLAEQEIANGIVAYRNINDLKAVVKEPESTIVFCHVPRKFSNPDLCVDYAYFAERKDGAIIPGEIVDEAARREFSNPSFEDIALFAENKGLNLRRENRGNEELASLYAEIGINKAVSAHFHESRGRANDLLGRHAEEGKYHNELFWNSGCLQKGTFGILAVSGNQIKYKNINLADYLRQ